jgi:prepilin-type N-terminal cleavage/methylation domain-containing protein
MQKKQGLTLIELLVVISILLIIIGITVQSFRYFQGREELSDSTEKIINILRLAQSKTLASEGASQYGVYFDTSTDPHQYTLFKTLSPLFNYASRDVNSDEVHQIPKSVEIYEIILVGGQEVVFSRLTGETANSGKVSLRLKSDNSKTRTVGVQSSGKITLGEEVLPDDIGRAKDSRHIHFGYSRIIDTLNETITLTFTYGSPTVTQTQNIPISSNIVAGQIYWEGEVDVNGQNQKIKIHTHRLNNPDTLFSVHRDRRFNDKALRISISGDPSVNLIEYPADGLTTDSTSLFVNNIQWQ